MKIINEKNLIKALEDINKLLKEYTIHEKTYVLEQMLKMVNLLNKEHSDKAIKITKIISNFKEAQEKDK